MLLRLLITLIFLASPHLAQSQTQLNYTLLETRPHNPASFTQGLIVDGPNIIESSGLYGQSFIQRYPKMAENPTPTLQKNIEPQFFAEGITQLDELLYLLTWKKKTLIVMDKRNFDTLYTLPYDGEGWGLATDGKALIMSNGSQTISFRDPKTFRVKHSIHVTDHGLRQPRLNELEFAEGALWANAWLSPYILQIDPQTGRTLGLLDLSDLVKKNNWKPGKSVLNGIAYDPEHKAFWVTGKLWHERYLIKITR